MNEPLVPPGPISLHRFLHQISEWEEARLGERAIRGPAKLPVMTRTPKEARDWEKVRCIRNYLMMSRKARPPALVRVVEVVLSVYSHTAGSSHVTYVIL